MAVHNIELKSYDFDKANKYGVLFIHSKDYNNISIGDTVIVEDVCSHDGPTGRTLETYVAFRFREHYSVGADYMLCLNVK